jgi:hypothetical protein
MTTSVHQLGETRQCVYCGKPISVSLTQCPFCREAIPQVRLSHRSSSGGRIQMRRGLLYMLLAGVIYYFAAGYGMPWQLPVQVAPIVTHYLSPLLFLGGLGLTLYALFLRMRA